MKKTDRRGRIERNKSKPILSEDLISTEILPRLSAKDLLRCKSVSKSWNALTSNPFCVSLHLDRARKRLPKLISVTINRKRGEMSLYAYDLSSNSKSGEVSFLFDQLLCKTQRCLLQPQHCNGLVLLPFATGQFYVCNPTTQQLLTLPKGDTNSFSFGGKNLGTGFCFVPGLNAYKVVRYFHGPCGLRFEVLTLGSDSSWRVISDVPPYQIDVYSGPVSAGESIYFRVDLHSFCPKVFVVLNLKDEKFRVVDPPSSDLTVYHKMKIFSLEGKPCFVYNSTSTDTYNMWISVDRKNHEWIHICSFSVEGRQKWKFQPVCVHSGKLLLSMSRLHLPGFLERLEYYDPQSISFEMVAKVRNLTFNGGHFFGDFLRKFERTEMYMYLGIESLVSVPGLDYEYTSYQDAQHCAGAICA